ncbi:MAG: galactose mutarotase [Clostridia bacterium]|nr:galactose mutarotase [Clostridia bacterium]
MNYTECGSYNGNTAKLFVLKSGILEVGILDFGARIQFIKVNGIDVTLGHKDAAAYVNSGSYSGGTVGRVGNRIKRGKFTLNGKEYSVSCNEGKNHLHGGDEGFDKKFFKVEEYLENRIVLSYLSPDGEEGYPANLKLTVTYTLADNAVDVKFEAVSDNDTLFAPTNHVYFNFDGEDGKDCLGNILQINADKYSVVDGELIPVGEAEVNNTPLDFNTAKKIGRDFAAPELEATNGYDHNYFLTGERAAHAESAKTGIYMDLFTNLPCMQFYSGGALKPFEGRTRSYRQWSGFCLEPQFCPNAINGENVAKPILLKGEKAGYYIRYAFGVK